MKRKILYILFSLILTSTVALADKFVPDFTQMKKIKCDVEETIFNQDGSVVTKNKYFRIFNLDDENQKIYLQKAPVDKINYYENDRIEFYIQSLTDDFIMQTNTVIERESGKYSSSSVIDYDSAFFGTRTAKAVGVCSAF